MTLPIHIKLGDEPPAKVLRLVRHARPELAAGICYGSTDVKADAQHTAQIAAGLVATLPVGVRLLSSPLQRCAVLARAVAAARADLRLRLEPRIVEMDFGCWEGTPWESVPAPAFDAWTAQFDSHRFGGAESMQMLMDRVAAVWNECCETSTPWLWITHAGVMNAAALLARGVTAVRQADQWPRAMPPYGAMVSLSLQRRAPRSSHPA